MTKLLYIQASPRERSKSSKVAQAFLDSYRQTHPGDRIKTLNLFEKDLPAFDGLAVQAKYSIMHGQTHTEEEVQAWSQVESVIAEFKNADKYLFSVPMWNFSIPYRFKHYIDLLVQPGYTFTVDEKGYQGLITGKSAAVIYARGGAYPSGSEAEAYDLQKKYVEQILGFIGFEKLETILVEPTLQGTPEMIEAMLQAAQEKAKQLAIDF